MTSTLAPEKTAYKKALGNGGAKVEKFMAIENVLSGNEDKALIGNWDERANKPESGAEEVTIKPGLYQIPNYSLVWGKRLMAKDKPTGECLFDKKWGEGEGYEAIEIRYAKNCASLDKSFQERANIKVHDFDTVLEISADVSYVNAVLEPAKALFFSVCSLNGSSPCRNPIADIMFYNYSPEAKITRQMEAFNLESEAMGMITEASKNTDMANVLADIFGLNAAHVQMEIIGDLMTKMKSNPIKFLGTIKETINAYSAMLKRAVEYGIMDIETPGLVKLKSGTGFDLLFNDMEDIQSDNKISWMISNIFTAEIYDKILQVNTVVNQHEN